MHLLKRCHREQRPAIQTHSIARKECCRAGWLMAMGAGSEIGIARGELGLSLA